MGCHVVVTLIKPFEVCYDTGVVSALCPFGPGSNGPFMFEVG